MGSWTPHFTSFCCCLGLEVGAKVIGFLHLFTALLFVCLCGFYSAAFGAHVGQPDDEELVYAAWYKIAVSVTIGSVVHVLLSLTLLYGAFQRNTLALRTWVVLMCVLFVAALLFVIAVTCIHGVTESGSHIFLTFLQIVLFFCVLAYCIICVNSFYMLVKNAEDLDGPTTYY